MEIFEKTIVRRLVKIAKLIIKLFDKTNGNDKDDWKRIEVVNK